MNAYKVLQGTHIDEAGKTYKKGQIIKTHLDLTTLFPQKFERVGRADEEASEQEKSAVTETPMPAATASSGEKAKSASRRRKPVGDDWQN